MAKWHVTYYYLATGMDGRPDVADYGVIEAESADAAKDHITRLFGDASPVWFKGCLTAEEVRSMQIKEVHYHEARLVSTAQFENARVEVGVTVSVDSTEPTAANAAMDHAREFVRATLVERITEIVDRSRQECDEVRQEAIAKKHGLIKRAVAKKVF